MRLTCCVVATALTCASSQAWALGEIIADIRVQNAARTDPETVRSIAGINIGDTLEANTLDKARERLYSAGLFADVNVYWEPYRDGVRINLVIKDKFPWAPVPTFSYAPGNTSGGLVIGHGNLFGRGKRGAIGGRYSTADSGALLGYEDPALFQTWLFYNVKGQFQDFVLPEYSNNNALTDMPLLPIRETKLRSFSVDVNLGVAWFRKIKTSVGWFMDRTEVLSSGPPVDSTGTPLNPYTPAGLDASSTSAIRGIAQASLTFDFRARQHAVMYGNALSFSIDYGSPKFGSDANMTYWKAGTSFEQGIRILKKHNLIVRAAASTGEDLPFWSESSTTSANLRGFLYRQFRGDTQLRTQVEYHFPLVTIMQLEVRGLGFNDTAATWYRKLPAEMGNVYETHVNGRSYLPHMLLVPGFDANRDVHTSVGGGIRFYLRNLSAPLVGVDVGHGIGTGTVRVIIVIGA